MKRIGIWFLLFFLCISTTSVNTYAAEPSVGAAGAALIDGKNGRLLWGKNADDVLAMASTTKIMTAILVLEEADLSDIVTISSYAARQPEVDMDLNTGEQWVVEDLLKAMMLKSYNDTAVALAEHVSGSEEAFCQKMTEKAKEIGAMDTVFGTPNGLDSHLTIEEHHSTAYDMALIGAYALENEKFREIIALPETTISEVNGKRTQNVTNADRLLREYQGAIGIKTGFTNRAGHCFVGAAERDDTLLVTTVLASGWGNKGKEGKWRDTKALLDYGFANFSPYTVVQSGDNFGELSVLYSQTEVVPYEFLGGYEGLFSEEELKKLELKEYMPNQLEAPIRKGDVLGRAEVWLGEELLAEIPLVASCGAQEYVLKDWLGVLKEGWCSWR